ncbi:MAG: hypothetical protein K6E54_00185 [Bacteroidaceae bacterium]|nr:hypothetical protein [Bacteroidaceae bacterium]
MDEEVFGVGEDKYKMAKKRFMLDNTYFCIERVDDFFTFVKKVKSFSMDNEHNIMNEDHKKLLAGLVWQSVGWNATRSDIEKAMKYYPITYDDVMNHRDYWLSLRKRCDSFEISST